MNALQIIQQFFTHLANPALLGFGVLLFLTPGPNNLMLAATGVNFSVRRGMPHLLGIVWGFNLMFILVASGLGSALSAHPRAPDVIRWLGLMMLVFLAYKIGTAKPKSFARGDDHDGLGSDVGNDSEDGRPISFLQAVIFQWVNPKAWITCTTIISLFMTTASMEDSSVLVSAVLLSLVLTVIGFPCTFCWLFFGAQIRRFITTPQRQTLLNRIMAGLLLLTGVSFVV